MTADRHFAVDTHFDCIGFAIKLHSLAGEALRFTSSNCDRDFYGFVEDHFNSLMARATTES
jgi:hypothetical protein